MRGKCNVVVWYFENWNWIWNTPTNSNCLPCFSLQATRLPSQRIQLYLCVGYVWWPYHSPVHWPHEHERATLTTVDRGRGLLKLNGSARSVVWWGMNPYFVSIKIIMYEIKTIFMDFLHFWFHINTRHLALVKHSIALYQNSKKENVQFLNLKVLNKTLNSRCPDLWVSKWNYILCEK